MSMRVIVKRIAAVLAATALVIGLGGCGDSGSRGGGNTEPPEKTAGTGADAREVLRVFNATDYIDMTTVSDFEREYNIRVLLTEFESNEELYEVVSKNPGAYDLLVPSDYTIDRLIQEGILEKIDFGNVPNISHVASQYLNPEYDRQGEYVVPYMVGTLGILYNKRLVTSAVDSWDVLWEPQYRGKILLWDSMRDIIGLALKREGFSLNSTDEAKIESARQSLLAQRALVMAYEGDIIRDYMIADEAVLAVVYSGEAKIAVDQNPGLAYVIPAEGSNKWVDGFVIVKGTQHKEAAELFINFMCKPNIAIRNMTATGYTSPVSGAWDEFSNNVIMFPTDEELARCEAFMYDRSATAMYESVWSEIRNGWY